MSENYMTASEVAQFHAEALRMRTEAEVLNKRAVEHHAAGDYAFGQAEHRLKTVQATEAGISAREKWLKENKEDELRQLAADAAADREAAQKLMADWNAVKHGAAQALIDINAREALAREQSAA